MEPTLTRLLRRCGEDEEFPSGFEAATLAQARGQLGLSFADEVEAKSPALTAYREGFSLHANTYVHPNDRPGLLKLCYYGARDPFASERLSHGEGGQYVYRMKRSVGGVGALVLSGAALVKKLLGLLPPPRRHLTKYFGVFSSHPSGAATS